MRRIIILSGIIIAVCTLSVQAEAPRDKILGLRGKGQLVAMQKAIVPYVAKARATYPAARKRFVAGSIPKNFFSVWMLFIEVHPQTKTYDGEYLFVVVDSIRNGIITGRINNKDISLKNYHFGQRVQVDESRVENWSIYHPDGSEEGNYVGKFLDHWTPPSN